MSRVTVKARLYQVTCTAIILKIDVLTVTPSYSALSLMMLLPLDSCTIRTIDEWRGEQEA